MNVYYVYKKEWCEYSEHRGMVVRTTSPQRAKGIAMARWEDEERSNVVVEELDLVEGIVCDTDRILNSDRYN